MIKLMEAVKITIECDVLGCEANTMGLAYLAVDHNRRLYTRNLDLPADSKWRHIKRVPGLLSDDKRSKLYNICPEHGEHNPDRLLFKGDQKKE